MPDKPYIGLPDSDGPHINVDISVGAAFVIGHILRAEEKRALDPGYKKMIGDYANVLAKATTEHLK